MDYVESMRGMEPFLILAIITLLIIAIAIANHIRSEEAHHKKRKEENKEKEK